MRDAAGSAPVESIREWALRNLGLKFDSARDDLLLTRLGSVSRRFGGSLADVSRRLHAGDRGVALVVAEELSTNHTSFFRERTTFDALRDDLLPSFDAAQPLRLWSAATSSGEEAYSMALSAVAAFGLDDARERVRVLGTDISERQLRRAERGTYDETALEHVDDSLRPYFAGGGPSGTRIAREIASMCVFRRLNLAHAPWPFEQRFHVVFVRNVLYYFEPAMRVDLLARVFDVTVPGGWLVTSVTEPLIEVPRGFIAGGPGIYRKVGGRR